MFPFTFYFLIIPGILVTIFLFSDSLDQLLSLYVLHPTPYSIIGSNYLHTEYFHLISNLILYLLVMPFIFFFDYRTNRKMLYVNMILLFMILPLVTSLLNIMSFTLYEITLPIKGFSAIAAGLFGYIVYSLLHYIREHHKVVFKRSVFQLMWLIISVNLLMISVIYSYHLVTIVILFLILISLMNTYQDYLRIIRKIQLITFLPKTILLFGFFFSLLTVVTVFFPGELQQGETLVNIYAHYTGYIFGFTVPSIISEYKINARDH